MKLQISKITIFKIILTFFLFLGLYTLCVYAYITTPQSMIDDTKFEYKINYQNSNDLYIINNLINENLDKMEKIHNISNSIRELSLNEEEQLLTITSSEYQIAQKLTLYYQNLYNQILEKDYKNLQELYPEATQIWIELKLQGFSDYAAAGILGNIMAECGGQTLNLNIAAGNNNYYGICQWSTKYYPAVYQLDLNGQIKYLLSTMPEIMGEQYYNLLNINNEQEAALLFAKYYERCETSNYNIRIKNAITVISIYPRVNDQ